MKIIKIVLILLSGLFFIGCGVSPVEKSISTAINRNVDFYFEDKTDDGNGPGYYDYPTDYHLYKQNTYDLKTFTVEEDDEFVYMKFKFNQEIHRNEEYFGRFDQIMIDVYIDKDQQPYSGNSKMLPGRDAFINPKTGWENVVLITPLDSESLKRFLEYDYENVWVKLLYKYDSIIIPDFYVVTYDTIIAKIPKNALGNPRKWWGYQVAVMGFSKDNCDEDNLFVMPVRANATEVNFGGGSSYYGNPNILDILDNGDQKNILGDYDINPIEKRAKFVRIPMIYKSKIKNKVKLNVKVSKKAEKFIKTHSEDIISKKKDEPVNDKNRQTCILNMRKILKAAKKYKKDNPDDKTVTLFDLLLSGYISEDIKCPSGGMYKIINEGDKIKVECIKKDGSLLHGVIE